MYVAQQLKQYHAARKNYRFYLVMTLISMLGTLPCAIASMMCDEKTSIYRVFDTNQDFLGFLKTDDSIDRYDLLGLALETGFSIDLVKGTVLVSSQFSSSLTGKALDIVVSGLETIGVKITGISTPSQPNYKQLTYGFMLVTKHND